MVNSENKKIKKVVSGISVFSSDMENPNLNRPLNAAERHFYSNLKKSLEQVKLYQEGNIDLRDVTDLLNEL